MCRYEWRRIRNGEKIIVDKGPAELVVEPEQGEMQGESNWAKLNHFFDEYERGLSKQERAAAKRLLKGRK